MKRPNAKDYGEWHGDYMDDLEKYIDFLESNQKEFVEWLEKNAKRCEPILSDSVYRIVLTKLKELNK